MTANRKTAVNVPWRKVLAWDALFQAVYISRFVSLEIWRASKSGLAKFEEMKFGETPVRTIRRILEHLPPLDETSLIYDLGCGRGRAAFLLHFLSGARVLALDAVATFIKTGRDIARWTGCQQEVMFYCEDFREADLEDADVIYACALCFGPATRRKLLENVLHNKPGCHLVSVGWRPEHPGLEPVAHFQAAFSWGPASVSISRLRHDPSLTVDGQPAIAPSDGATP